MADETVTAAHRRLTGEQYRAVLESVAGRTATLRQMLMLLQTNEIEDDFAQKACLDAAEAIATAIGAMADDAVNGSVIGNAEHWNYGPNFAQAGKGASHG